MAKYLDQNIDGQIAFYKRQGCPEVNGLYACGIIARRNQPKINRLNDLWMQENLRFSYQDQISMAYLLWKHGIDPAIFQYDIWTNPWGGWAQHAHDK